MPNPVVQEEVVKITSSNPNRKRYQKEVLLTKFKKSDEINFSSFEKDVLNWIEIFSSASTDPEATKSTDTSSDIS